MDEYLQCLYTHVMERLLLSPRPDLAEYRLRSIDQDQAWDALEKTLAPEQLQLLEAYQAAKSHVCAIEDRWLFQEAVSLGKWMARP